MVNLKNFAIFGFVLLLSACDNFRSVEAPRVFKYEVATNLKLIDIEENSPDAKWTYSQQSYEIDSYSRILVKTDGLNSEEVYVDDKFIMAFSIYSARGDLTEEELAGIKLCPVTKNWMIYATWEKAHPFQDGSWSKTGGDFNENECISVAAYNIAKNIIEPPEDDDDQDQYEFEGYGSEFDKNNEVYYKTITESNGWWSSGEKRVRRSDSEIAEQKKLKLQAYEKEKERREKQKALQAQIDSEALAPNGPARLQFNISDWFLNGPLATRGKNFGFVIISEHQIEFLSEQSASKPTISWTEPGY